MKKQVENSDFRLCIPARVLGVDLKALEKNKRFSELVRTKGFDLEGGEVGGTCS